MIVHYVLLTRDAGDAALLLDICKGPHPRDMTCLPPTSEQYTESQGVARQFRCLYIRRPFGVAPHPEILARTDAAVEALSHRGVAITELAELGSEPPTSIFD